MNTTRDQNEPGLEPEVDYPRLWRAFGLRYYLALFLLFSWLPVAIGLFCLSRFETHRPVLSLTVMLLWLFAALLSVWWAGEFRCPRCRRRFGALGSKKGSTNLTRGLFDQVCANCKLRRFEYGGERRVSQGGPRRAFDRRA